MTPPENDHAKSGLSIAPGSASYFSAEDEEICRKIDAMTPGELDAYLRANGIDPTAIEKMAEGIRREAAKLGVASGRAFASLSDGAPVLRMCRPNGEAQR